jgi:predicted lipid-binding transport protein (Tim44 family)
MVDDWLSHVSEQIEDMKKRPLNEVNRATLDHIASAYESICKAWEDHKEKEELMISLTAKLMSLTSSLDIMTRVTSETTRTEIDLDREIAYFKSETDIRFREGYG